MEPLAPLDRATVRQLLEAFDLRTLFVNELGWDHGGADTAAVVGETTFPLQAIAQKRGFVAYQCVAGGQTLPDYATRQKIERQVAKDAHEHLIVFAPKDHGTLCWQWVKREMGRPPRPRQHTYSKGQSAEALAERLDVLRFTLEEEEEISTVDAALRVAKAFDVEKVTKRFYDRFRTEHQAFLGFIKGIRDAASREWYASLMLNRMMFIYFIQKRGFLNDEPDYLRNRLASVAKTKGSGKFHSFYRLFLRRLFHEGLGQPEAARDAELGEMLGRVPYLNGGLFDVHDLERDNANIDIPDKAFKQIFDFFDAYQWHLDDRPLRDDNEINPDVLGYIFEKYVNQKQMGAYYTKEDITGYISRNTIVPHLFDQAKRDCAIAFKPGGSVWRLLAEDPNRYFYPSVRHGITFDMHDKTELDKPRALPKEVAVGLKDVAKRGEWNNAAPPEYALPIETWREHIARRQRYEEVCGKLAAGEVCSINDLVTYNLDIEQFAEDAIRTSEGPELVRAFWKAIRNVTVLDPTVGSGAFLFAALNVLEPLYNACLDAMRGLVDDLKHSKRKQRPDKLGDFAKVLDDIDQHPSERYFVLKSIVIDNLYGVDIMEEAVEICKLRLFLKLVAQLENYEQIEPLPDIDFNVRPGNTLVGFTSMQEVQDTLGSDVVSLGSLPAIEKSAEEADDAFRQFRAMQTERHLDAAAAAESKTTLRHRLDELRKKLDAFLADDYGIRRNQTALRKWQRSHQPFHWLVEFYGIMARGGFDVVIGNPPYIASAKVRQTYDAKNLECGRCPDVYAWVLERSQMLLRSGGRTGMIVPLSLGFSAQFAQCRQMLLAGYSHNWFASFGRIPSALFSFDVRVRNTIQLALKSTEPPAAYTSRLHRWFDAARPALFEGLAYAEFQPHLWKGRVPKIGSSALLDGMERLLGNTGTTADAAISKTATEHVLHFKQTAYNWLNFCRVLPPCFDASGGQTPHTEFGGLYYETASAARLAMALANGKLMFCYWAAVGDDFHVARWNFADFPVDLDALPSKPRQALLRQATRLEAAMANAVQFKRNAGKRVGNYNLARCRSITDVSDRLFLDALGAGHLWHEIELYYAQTVRTDFR